MSNCSLGFSHRNESWFWTDSAARRLVEEPGVVDEFVIGDYSGDGSTRGEFRLSFVDLGVRASCIPRLSMFNDSWHLMLETPIQRLFARLAELGDVTPDDLKSLLLDLGFSDLTKRNKTGSL